VRLVNPMDGPLGEEPGWRGFAVPRMQARTSPLVTAVILGVLVAGWQLPLVFAGDPPTVCRTALSDQYNPGHRAP
jgi:hypothetical protein